MKRENIRVKMFEARLLATNYCFRILLSAKSQSQSLSRVYSLQCEAFEEIPFMENVQVCEPNS